MSQIPPGLVVGCTNRKRVPAEFELQASSLPLAEQCQVEAAWSQSLRLSEKSTLGRNLYCGRGFLEAVRAASHFGGPLWVVSAGLGLVNSDDLVPSYNLTLTPGAEQSIRKRVNGSNFDAHRWWLSVNSRTRDTLPPLASLVTREAPLGRCFIVALSSQYLGLVAQDLLAIPTEHRESLRLLSRNELPRELSSLAPYTLVYGDRLDGPDSPIPGIRADFTSRMARHFAENVWERSAHGTINAHQKLLCSSLNGFRSPVQLRRSRRSDNEIMVLIDKLWGNAGGRSSRMLRLLRDEENIACEQSRFTGLFRLVATKRASQ